MRTECTFRILRHAVLVAVAACVLAGCKSDPETEQEPVPPPPPTTGETAITMTGTATDGLADADKMLKESDGIFSYSGILVAGDLSFKTVQDGKEGFLYINSDQTAVSTSGTTAKMARGYYDFRIALEEGSFEMKKRVEFGSADVFLSGGEVFMPRTGDPTMPVMSRVEGSGFEYEYFHFLGEGSFHFYFQNEKTASTAYRNPDGTVAFFGSDGQKSDDTTEWMIDEPGGYKIAVDIQKGEVALTPVNFFPDNIVDLYVVGNTFGNGGATAAEVDAALTADGSQGAVRMTRSDAENHIFTIEQDLKADGGGIWFLFQQRHTVPALIRDTETTGRFFFTADPDDGEDTDPANQWTVDVDDNYTITVDIRTREVSIEPTVPKEYVIPEGYDLYVTGDSDIYVAEENRRMVLGDDGYYRYNGVWEGGMHFVAKKDGEEDIFLYYIGANQPVGTEGSLHSVARGFHEFSVERLAGIATHNIGKEIGDYVWMHALHVNYPRYGTSDPRALLPVAVTADNPFVFEFASTVYFLTEGNDIYTGYSFFLANTHDDSFRLYDAGEGKIGLGGVNDWSITETTDLHVTLDLTDMTHKAEKITMYPDYVQGVWAIGNTFSSNGAEEWGIVEANMEEIVSGEKELINSDFGPSMVDRYTFDGWNHFRPIPERFPMARTGNVFTITKDLRADLGGFWFLLRAKGSLPCIVNDGTGKATFFAGDVDAPTDQINGSGYSSRYSKDARPEGHWHITEDGNYTITLDISTGDVTITKN